MTRSSVVNGLLAKAACAFASVCALGASVDASAATPIARNADLLNSIGINTHIIYTDSQYANINAVISSLKYTGVRLIRDVAPNPSNAGQGSYASIAAAGITMDLFNGGDAPGGSPNPATSVAAIEALASKYPGSIHSIEGPNEVNNGSVTYGGVMGIAGAQAYQASLYANSRAQPALKQIPVYNMTNYPDAAGKADYANFHSYPNGLSSCNSGGLAANMASQQKVMPSYSLVNTELGASTKPQSGSFDQVSQARFLLTCLLDNAAAGVKETYFYQLLDAYADPKGSNTQDHFGFFDSSYNPKTSATMLRNLYTWLADTGANATTFVPQPSSWTVTGLPSTARTLTLARSDGSTWIFIWNEVPIFTEANGGAPLNVATSTVKFTFPAKHQVVGVVDPVTGGNWWAGNTNVITCSNFGIEPMIMAVSAN